MGHGGMPAMPTANERHGLLLAQHAVAIGVGLRVMLDNLCQVIFGNHRMVGRLRMMMAMPLSTMTNFTGLSGSDKKQTGHSGHRRAHDKRDSPCFHRSLSFRVDSNSDCEAAIKHFVPNNRGNKQTHAQYDSYGVSSIRRSLPLPSRMLQLARPGESSRLS